MITLAVDTSTPSGSLALLRGQQVLQHSGVAAHEPYSVSLLRDLERLLASVAISLNQIDLFAVSGGPGSFTGLRIGLTTVKALAETLGRPITVVSSLEAIAAQATKGIPANTLLVPVLDAHQGQVFGGMYRCHEQGSDILERSGDDVLATVDDFINLVMEGARGAPVLIACPTPNTIRPALERSGLRASPIEEVSAQLAPTIGRLGYAKAQRGDVVDALHLDANYIRRCDAEVKWRNV
jgi:tRNA threonylcarbamoyladenosine biosynthesis protein TsaB